MKSTILPLFASLLLITVTGCQSLPQAGAANKGQVTHVVVCWLKHHGNAAERAKLIEASKSFKAIPGVTDVSVGKVLVSQRPGSGRQL